MVITVLNFFKPKGSSIPINSAKLSILRAITLNLMSVFVPDFKTIALPDEEAHQTYLKVVRFKPKRVIFGRGRNIPKAESDLSPA